MSRKPYLNLSNRGKKIASIGQIIGLKFYGDTNWSIAEAITIETPIGECHLHWTSHRGRGNWKIITNPKWRGEICGTARCRKVIITPLGGDNESANLGDKAFDVISDEWLWSKWGACCYWPRLDPDYPPYIHTIDKYRDEYNWKEPVKQYAS